ncbi:cobaltochelatase subunit CobN (plasmid) [Novosphingobium sp. BL-8A]
MLLVALLAPALAPTFALARTASDAADRPVVRIVSTHFVLPAKFVRLARWAEEAGYRIEWRYAEDAGSGAADIVTGADLLVIDGPRPGDRAAIEKALGPASSLTVAWIAAGGGPPAWGRLDEAAARRLIGYYAGGGEANLTAFAKAAMLVLSGSDLSVLPPPAPLPASGLYHPQAPSAFGEPADFAAWMAARGKGPVVAFAISEGQVRDMQTGVLGALAGSAEARGLSPVFFWYDERDPQALTRVLRPLRAQALVNLTHMQNGDARKDEFEALDIPVLQGLVERGMTPAEWRAAPSGITGASGAVMLSVPESWGISDPLVIGAVENGEPVPIPEQIELMTAKLARLVALRNTPPADKRLALFFWNYPVGERNLAASNLNLPLSLAKLTRDLAAAGYDVKPAGEQDLIATGQAMLGGLYRPESLDELAARGLAERLPLAEYKAWFATLPEPAQQAVASRWGRPEDSPALRGGAFLIPRLMLGNLTILPQPPRGGDPTKSYHDAGTPPDHRYLATYLWTRIHAHADAIIHFGTHGTQEWTPGKDRGLWAGDFPMVLLGDVPVFYPYIQDNVAEAIQARRRGRAVTISHQTPAFAPSGLYDELRDIHALIHEYAQLDAGPVRDRVAGEIVGKAGRAHFDAELGWDKAAIARDFGGYYTALHDRLHQIARASVPLGLHTFGEASEPVQRLTTVMQQLGPDYLLALGQDPVEAFAEDFSRISESAPYLFLRRYLREGGDPASIADPALRAQVIKALAYDRNLAEPSETEALLQGLAGGFVRAGPGGDPVREPEAASGRNLYAFDAQKVPTPAAYAEGGRALDRLLEAYREKHGGEWPRKLAFSMFSSETIRTLGIGEGQILQALGLRPVWGRGGKVEGLEIVPAVQLGHPRIDVLMQPTSVYRDQFDVFMRLLADGIDRVAALDEPTGPAANARALEKRLVASGMAQERALDLSRLRIFTNVPGDYGTGLPDRVVADGSGAWKDEASLAEPYLARLGHAYGARDWGLSLKDTDLFAEQLRDVDAAVLVRSSNVHGLLSTDHPFEHLGGLSLAVRTVSGRAPDLFVTDMRGSEARVTSAGGYISEELRARYLNPQWISAMQQEGYAGANAMAAIVNNLWGWQVTDPGSVRADQWQAMHETYVADTRKLGLGRFFARVHPGAQLQMVDRMLEAVSRGYWKPDSATRVSLARRRADVAQAIANADRSARMQLEGSGFGLTAAAPSAGASPASTAAASSSTVKSSPSAASAPPPPPPFGRVLERQKTEATPLPTAMRGQMPALFAIVLFFLIGVALEAGARRTILPRKTAHAST